MDNDTDSVSLRSLLALSERIILFATERGRTASSLPGFSPCCRSRARGGSKGAREVTLVGESHGVGDFGHRHGGVEKKPLRLGNSNVEQPTMRRHAGRR